MFPPSTVPSRQIGLALFPGSAEPGRRLLDLLAREGPNPARDAAAQGISHAVILADVFTKFLDPLTRTVSPLLLQVGNVPIVDHMLHHLFSSGLKSITIVSSVQCDLLDQYITNISRWQMKYNFFDGFDAADHIFDEQGGRLAGSARAVPAHLDDSDEGGAYSRYSDEEGPDGTDVVAEIEGRQQPLLTINLVRSTSKTQLGAFRQAYDKIPASQSGRAFLLICGPVLSNINLTSLSRYHAAFPPSWVITPIFQHMSADSALRPIDSAYTVFRDYESGRLVRLARDKPGTPEDAAGMREAAEPGADEGLGGFVGAGRDGQGVQDEQGDLPGGCAHAPSKEAELLDQARARRATAADQLLFLNFNSILNNAAESRLHARRMGRRESDATSNEGSDGNSGRGVLGGSAATEDSDRPTGLLDPQESGGTEQCSDSKDSAASSSPRLGGRSRARDGKSGRKGQNGLSIRARRYPNGGELDDLHDSSVTDEEASSTEEDGGALQGRRGVSGARAVRTASRSGDSDAGEGSDGYSGDPSGESLDPLDSADSEDSISRLVDYFTQKDQARAERAGARAGRSAIITAKLSGADEQPRKSLVELPKLAPLTSPAARPPVSSAPAAINDVRAVTSVSEFASFEQIAQVAQDVPRIGQLDLVAPAPVAAVAGGSQYLQDPRHADAGRHLAPVFASGPSSSLLNLQAVLPPAPTEQSFPIFPPIPAALSSLEVSRSLCCTNVFVISPSFFRRIISNSDFHGNSSILSIIAEIVGSDVHAKDFFVGSYILPAYERAVRIDSLRTLREATHLYLKGYLAPYSPQANLYYIGGARTAFSKVTGRGFELFKDSTCGRDASARLMGTLMLGKHTRLQADCFVASSVLGNYVQVDSHSFVAGSQIGSNSHVKGHAVVLDSLLSSFCIVDPYVVLPRGSVIMDTTNITQKTVYAAIRAMFQIMFSGKFDVYWCLCLTLAAVRSSHMGASDYQLLRFLDGKRLGVEARDPPSSTHPAFPYPRSKAQHAAANPHAPYAAHLAQQGRGSHVSTGKFLLSCATSIYNFLLGNTASLSTYIIAFFIPPVYIGRQSYSTTRTQYYSRCLEAFEQKEEHPGLRGMGMHLVPRTPGHAAEGSERSRCGSMAEFPQTLSFVSEGPAGDEERYDTQPQQRTAGEAADDSTLTSASANCHFEPNVLPAVFDVRLDKMILPEEDSPALPCEDSGLSQSSSQSSPYIESDMLTVLSAAPAEKSVAALIRQAAEPTIKGGALTMYVIPSYAVLSARTRIASAQRASNVGAGMYGSVSLSSTWSVGGAALPFAGGPMQKIGSGLFDTIPLSSKTEAGLTVGAALRQGEPGAGACSGISTPATAADHLGWADGSPADVSAALEQAQRDSMAFLLLNGYYYIPPRYLRELLEDSSRLEGVDLPSARPSSGVSSGLTRPNTMSSAELAFVQNIPLSVQGFSLPELDTDYFVADPKPWISTEATARYLLSEIRRGEALDDRAVQEMVRGYTCLGDAQGYVSALEESIRKSAAISPQFIVSQSVAKAMQDSRYRDFPVLEPRTHIPEGDRHPPAPDPALLQAGLELLRVSRLNITTGIKVSGDRQLQTNSTVMAEYVLKCVLLLIFFDPSLFRGLNEQGECILPEGADLMRLSGEELTGVLEKFYHALDFWTHSGESVFEVQQGDDDDRTSEELLNDFRNALTMCLSDFIVVCVESGAIRFGEGPGSDSDERDEEEEEGEEEGRGEGYEDLWGGNMHTGYTDGDEDDEDEEEEEEQQEEEDEEGQEEDEDEDESEGDAPGEMTMAKLLEKIIYVLLQFKLTSKEALEEWEEVLRSSTEDTDRKIYKHVISTMNISKRLK